MVAIVTAFFGYAGAVVVPKLLADNSPPYVGLKHEPISSEVEVGGKFCYFPTADHRRDCASVSGQHIFTNGKIEFREPWHGTAKPGRLEKSLPWCADAPPKPGTYQYFWAGTFVGCKGATTDLGFISPSLPVAVTAPKIVWPEPEIKRQ